MGYTTTFRGVIAVEPPLNRHEIAYLRRFADTRRMDRDRGPYYCGTGHAGQDDEPDIRDYDRPGPDQPGLWCKWGPTDDGRGIEWNRAEKFYDAEKWMAYLIRTFLMPGASLAGELTAPVEDRYYAPEFEHFTFDHVLNGVIHARGEETDDVWQLVVTDGEVVVRQDGEDSEPVTDTGPMTLPDWISGRTPVILVGGPHHGEQRMVPLASLGELELADGTRYVSDPNAATTPDITGRGVILRFEED